MRLALIAAVARNGVIGRAGDLPWRIAADLQHFKNTTMGKPMIMGRATYDAIGSALPGRKSIVLTRQADFAAEGCDVVTSVEAAIDAAGDAKEVMIIGGGEIYRQFLMQADRIYLTRVQAEVAGDTRFPELDMNEWAVTTVEEYPAGDDREIGFDIETLDRVRA